METLWPSEPWKSLKLEDHHHISLSFNCVSSEDGMPNIRVLGLEWEENGWQGEN